MCSICWPRVAFVKPSCARVRATINDWSARDLLRFARTAGMNRALLGGVLGQLVARAPLLMTAAGS